MIPGGTLALVRPEQVDAGPPSAGLVPALVDVDAAVGEDVVGEVKAGVAATAEAAVEVDAVAVPAARVGVDCALVDVLAVAADELGTRSYLLFGVGDSLEMFFIVVSS